MIEAGSVQFWRATLALCVGSFMIFANVYITQPLLPMLQHEFQISTLQAGWSFTITTLTLGISLLLYGPLSDALGRRGLMLISMAGATAITLLLGFVDSYCLLLLLRGLQGFFLAGLPAIAIAYMGDEFNSKALMLAVGLYISGNTLGGISGRLIGGGVGDWLGWSEAFRVMGLVSLCCVLLFALLLPKSKHFVQQPLHPGTMLLAMWRHLCNPLLLLVYLIGGFNFFIFINQYSYITFVLSAEPYNLSASWLGMLFVTYLSGTFGSAISGRLAQRYGQLQCIALGIAILMLGSCVTLVSDITAIVVGFFINSFGFFFAHSTASSWVSRHARQSKASASSLYLVFYYLGASSGSFYLDPFWRTQGWSGVVTGSLLVLCGTLLATLLLFKYDRVRHIEAMDQP